jgi:hypothetical protein
MATSLQPVKSPHVIVPLAVFRTLLTQARCHEVKSDLLETEFSPEVRFSSEIKTLPLAAYSQPSVFFVHRKNNETNSSTRLSCPIQTLPVSPEPAASGSERL